MSKREEPNAKRIKTGTRVFSRASPLPPRLAIGCTRTLHTSFTYPVYFDLYFTAGPELIGNHEGEEQVQETPVSTAHRNGARPCSVAFLFFPEGTTCYSYSLSLTLGHPCLVATARCARVDLLDPRHIPGLRSILPFQAQLILSFPTTASQGVGSGAVRCGRQPNMWRRTETRPPKTVDLDYV